MDFWIFIFRNSKTLLESILATFVTFNSFKMNLQMLDFEKLSTSKMFRELVIKFIRPPPSPCYVP